MEVKEIKIRDIDLIDDETQGIYSWHLKPKRLDENKILKLFEAFNKFEMKLTGSAIFNQTSKFGDKFEGKLNRNNGIVDVSENIKSLNIDFLITFLKENSFPLYIGRSKNIKKRLTQHYNIYRNAMTTNFLATMIQEFDNDTDEESGYFGMRLANLNQDRWFLENELFIKYYSNEELNYDSIKEIEFFLNRFYKPILGLI
jgi:hypothetical protein